MKNKLSTTTIIFAIFSILFLAALWVVRSEEGQKDKLYKKYLEMYSDTTVYKSEKEQIANSFAMNIDSLRSLLLSEMKRTQKDICFQDRFDYIYDPLHLYGNLVFVDKDTARNIRNYVIIPDRASVFYKIKTENLIMSHDKNLCLAFLSISPRDANKIKYEQTYRFYPIIGCRRNENEDFRIYPRADDLAYILGWDSPDIVEWGIKDFVTNSVEHSYNDGDIFDDPRTGFKIAGIPILRRVHIPTICDDDYFEQPLFQKYNDSTYNFQWFYQKGKQGLGKYADAEKGMEIHQFHYPY